MSTGKPGQAVSPLDRGVPVRAVIRYLNGPCPQKLEPQWPLRLSSRQGKPKSVLGNEKSLPPTSPLPRGADFGKPSVTDIRLRVKLVQRLIFPFGLGGTEPLSAAPIPVSRDVSVGRGAEPRTLAKRVDVKSKACFGLRKESPTTCHQCRSQCETGTCCTRTASRTPMLSSKGCGGPPVTPLTRTSWPSSLLRARMRSRVWC